MRRYETIFILDPDLSDEGRVPVFDRIRGLIPGQGGTLLDLDEWGARRLAYEIKKRVRGYYVRADYCGSGDVVNEMERFFRIDDRVLKYMTVLLDEDADEERLKVEFTKTEGEEAAAEKSETDDATNPGDEPDTADADAGENAADPAEAGELKSAEAQDDTSETETSKEA
jgi:small subunit ribosomal protein S6